MNRQGERSLKKFPHPHQPFWERPALSRRSFFQVLGTGITGCALYHTARPLRLLAQSSVVPMNTAKNCIFILLQGAPSHTDTFDLKEGSWTPSEWNPASYGEIRFPQGLMPNIAERLDEIVIIRSVRAWALVHSLARTWIQIGRSPASALGSIAPNIGSIVALEKASERTEKDILPGFLALNARGNQVGAGYLPVTFAPFRLQPRATGLQNTIHPDGKERWENRRQALRLLDDSLRIGSPWGDLPQVMDEHYDAAGKLMYNDGVQTAFSFTEEERSAYGTSSFGDACLIATKALSADLGTRFVQITMGGWDNHADIYGTIPGLAETFDNGFAALLDGLQQNSLLQDTLLVVAGEFGRTVGPLNSRQGRDHYLQQFALFAGGGVHGGRTIGETDATGAYTVEPGWSRGRDVRNEDIEATIYSALGIDWTTVRHDDPLNRGFEYVPYANLDIYGPINELWE